MGGGGGGGVQAYHLIKKTILSNELEGDGQDTSRHFEGRLGPCVQYFPCEVSKQKKGPKTKIELKEKELSHCLYLICPKKTSI